MPFRLLNAFVDTVEFDGKPSVAVRGLIDLETLNEIETPDYQREIMQGKKHNRLVEALKTTRLPDVDLATSATEYKTLKDGTIEIQGIVFMVDGQQRLAAARKLRCLEPTRKFSLGAIVHLGQTDTWEQDRFETMNVTQSRVSPNVLLRNRARRNENASPSAQALLNLSMRDKRFPLHRRVQWDQRRKKGELVTALVFAKTAGQLHSHIGPGLSSSATKLVDGLDIILDEVGRNTFIANVRTFFQIIDELWGIEELEYHQGAYQLYEGFLRALALFFSEHENFWKGDGLVVSVADRKKLKGFQVNRDHNLQNLAQGNKVASNHLKILLADHYNSGKRRNRLRPRQVELYPQDTDADEAADEQ